MIFATPLLLAAIPYGICYAITKNADKLTFYNLVLRLIWLLVVLGILISMAIKLFPYFYQGNLTDQMLFLPIALVFTFHPAGIKEIKQKYLSKITFKRREK
jgi:cytochrome c biogenesis protein CcdA